MAHCGTNGWADDLVEREDLPRPAWIDDDTAFWVSAQGTSMQPEGIRSGDFCVVSPGRRPQAGDRVWVREATAERRVAIKRLIELDQSSATLRGWLPPENGTQSDFLETRPLAAIDAMHPVIGVYRGRLGKSGVDVRFIPDSRDGQGAGADEMHVLQLTGDQGELPDRWRVPTALGFPKSWFRRRHLSPDDLALVAVTDDRLAPMIPQWSVAVIDTSVTAPRGRDLLALRIDGRPVVRWAQAARDGSWILSGADPSEPVDLIPPSRQATAAIMGRVIWSGKGL
ncbi:S24 family peptidase [Sedimentitalea sp. JM2-8]|uniref:S24 family peptidase n=1 Tax=Sedimentitalea xiamensis TaxID=3050037 RepID=A0ABT7FC80_9RHOB|nr:S24 family peptidase [Sedimentitalea xiamensis]MDK3072721.1 S24 family peptidase [Sedimentitalea xiamensis]